MKASEKIQRPGRTTTACAKGLVTALVLAASASSLDAFAERSARAEPRIQVHRIQAGEQVQYYGGPVTSNVQVVGVLWGPTVNPEVASKIGGFYQAITASPYLGQLSEYDTTGLDGGSNQTIGSGSFASVVTITPTTCGTTLQDSQISAELFKQIQMGKLPAPTKDSAGHVNTVYMVDLPQGYTVIYAGDEVCEYFCDYYSHASSAGMEIYYSVFPDLYPGSPCYSYCGQNSAPFDNVTARHSAELGNLITDPVLGSGWLDAHGEGIGFICGLTGLPGEDALVSGYVVQKLWSNASSACVATGGSDYDAGTPETPVEAGVFETPDCGTADAGPDDAAEPDAPGTETGTDSGGVDASIRDAAPAEAGVDETGSPDGSPGDANAEGGGSGGSGGCSCHASGVSAGSLLGTWSLAALGIALLVRRRTRSLPPTRRRETVLSASVRPGPSGAAG